ncbi:Arginyl-tRNA--protein transferase [hydrothermal vent metagenome]|uniref:Arginyl-tRNA--protein transferase n=1 Tax=hydrothermal vent metagenome TaxID=652676 RepID=A0A3B0ZI90_9ZZZZ
MNRDKQTGDEQSLRFYATPPRPCTYLENRSAISVFADPDVTLSPAIYEKLAPLGFRRSGKDLYIPACANCNQCIPARVMVETFQRTRSQQRVWQRNRDVSCSALDARFEQEHFELYCRYLSQRHPGGGMENPSPDDYLNFMTSNWSDTLFLEFRHNGSLLGVAVTDCLPDALSSVYTFFDPEFSRHSPGTLAILTQIETARELGLSWLYLGYWVSGCRKMTYKNRFRPLQVFRDGNWQHFDPGKNYDTPPQADDSAPPPISAG